MVKEEHLHAIWRYGLFCGNRMKTTCGDLVEIYCRGSLNVNAGPDFFNARMKIGRMEWAGNVEIHSRSSDWNKHGHHSDPAYDSVILHVVLEFDSQIFNSRGRKIDTLVLCIPDSVISLIEALPIEESWLPCNRYIHQVPRAIMKSCYRQLNSERLEQKSGRILKELPQKGSGREEALIRAMASGFGVPLNTLPFEMLFAGIPYPVLFDLRDNTTDLEAFLFGRSGFLHPQLNRGPYARKLAHRYHEKMSSLPGSPVPLHLWKFLRLRPASFPTLRLSQFATLLNLRLPFTATLLSFASISEIEQLLKVRASEYWDTHYVFGKCSPAIVKYTGTQSIHTLIINVIVPFLHAIGKRDQQTSSIIRANDILNDLEAESNTIIKKWITFGIVPDNAFESQALIQLHKGYCKQKRCLECQLGIRFSSILQ